MLISECRSQSGRQPMVAKLNISNSLGLTFSVSSPGFQNLMDNPGSRDAPQEMLFQASKVAQMPTILGQWGSPTDGILIELRLSFPHFDKVRMVRGFFF